MMFIIQQIFESFQKPDLVGIIIDWETKTYSEFIYLLLFITRKSEKCENQEKIKNIIFS